MTTAFNQKIVKGNKTLTGFARLPHDKSEKFSLGQTIKVTISANNAHEIFYATIRDYSGIGFYVPKEMVIRHNLIGKTATVIIQKENGFVSKIGNDGRIYPPINISEKNGLSDQSIVLIKGRVGGEYRERYSQVDIRQKKAAKEYRANFNSHFAGKQGIFEITNITEKNRNAEYSPLIHSLLRDFNFARTENDILPK